MTAGYRHHVSDVDSGSVITVDPSGLTHVAGDGLLLIVSGYESLGNPSGSDVTWTEIGSDTQAGPFAHTDITRAWRAYSDGALSSFTIANGLSDQYEWCLLSLSDVDPTDFCPAGWWGFASNVFSSDPEPDSPSVDPDAAPGLLVAALTVWAQNDGTSSFSPPSGMTERVDIEAWDSMGVATLANPSDPTGAKAWTESPGLGDSSAWIAASFAIKSSSGEPTHSRTISRVLSTHTG